MWGLRAFLTGAFGRYFSLHYPTLTGRLCFGCGWKPRYEILEIKTEQTTRQNQWCINYTSKILDKQPANSTEPQVMYDQGFFILHPSYERSIVKTCISQRGKEADIKETLDDDMQYLNDNLRIVDKEGNLIE